MRRFFLIIFAIFFIGIGIFVLVHGNGLAKRCTEEAIGTVVNVIKEDSTDSDGFTSYTYTPVIEYKVGEKTITKRAGSGSGSPEYQINDTIDILYNPNNVEEFIIKGESSTLFGIIFIVVGAIAFLVGLRQLLMGR